MRHEGISVLIWLDDIRSAPKGYEHFHSVNETKNFIRSKIEFYKRWPLFEMHFYLDLDHDLGDYAKDGGDAINLIKFLIQNEYNEMKNVFFHFKLHTMNPVGRENMQALINRYF